MRSVTWIGILLIVLGIASFVVPIPQRENHGVKVGDAKIGIQTETSQKLPPAVGGVLVIGGVLALVFAAKK